MGGGGCRVTAVEVAVSGVGFGGVVAVEGGGAAKVKVGVSAGGEDGGGCRRRVAGIWPEWRRKMGGEKEGVCVVARVIMNETLVA
ncbi:hypothetical protein Tco_1083253 [Tanacetum coccineum]